MQDYTNKVNYKQQSLTKGESFEIDKYNRLQIEPNHPSYADHEKDFDMNLFKYPYMPLFLGKYKMDIENIDVNVLRLPIRLNKANSPGGKDKIFLPKECLFAKDFILAQINYHRQFYWMNSDAYIYLTIRTTEKDCWYSNSQNWHIDGFQGSSNNVHIPEQDFIWSNVNPTEFLLQPFYVDGLDPSKNDINEYFNDNANEAMSYKGVENGVYVITPYNVHRVSNNEFNEKRVFIRLNFSPIAIDDDTNTQNPMLPLKYSNRKDVRNFLWSYELDETINNGFIKL